MPVIGFLSSGSPRTFANFLRAFQEGPHEQGFVEGRNVLINYYWAEGHFDELDALATQLVAGNPTVIAATGGMRSAEAAKRATATIPVVFVIGFDPVQLGLVASFNKPGGNVTGTSIFTTQLGTKRLGLLYQLVSGAHNFAILVNPQSTSADIETGNAIEAAKHSGQPLLVLKASSEVEIDEAIASATKQGVSGIVVSADPLFMIRRARLTALAMSSKIAVVYPFREFVDAGGLMSYGPNLELAYRHSGNYTGRILKGANPADLPIVVPTSFELIINLKAAKALGLNVKPDLLAVADEVIE
jgi:putative ABC transport system substrate-binding protein